MEKTKILTKQVIMKGGALAFAGIMCAGLVPAGITTLGNASAAVDIGNKSIYLLNTEDTTVKGGTYKIRQAYFGSTAKIPFGLSAEEYETLAAGINNVSTISSEVKVVYAGTGKEITITKEASAGNAYADDTAGQAVYGSIPVDYKGEYVIRYSMTIDGKTYSMDFELDSTAPEASFSFETNSEKVLPKVIDLMYDKVKNEDGSVKDIIIPRPEIKNKDGKSVPNLEFVANKAAATAKDFVVVSVSMSGSGNLIKEITAGEDIKVLGSDIAEQGAGTYTILYTYYSKPEGASLPQFVSVSDPITFEVKNGVINSKGEHDVFHKDYALKASVGASKQFITGVETELPSVSATATYKNATGANTTEEVNFYYEVEAYRATAAGRYDEEVPKAQIYKNEDGKLVFKPEKDGRYKIVYSVWDFYGNKVEATFTTSGEITDTQAPEVFVYDAADTENNNISEGKFKDAAHQIKSKAFSKNIVIPAIAATDNVSKMEDEKSPISMQRRVYYSTSSEIIIKDFNSSNLIFNYEADTLLAQNPIIAKKLEAENITGEENIKTWLKGHGYLIVKSDLAAIARELGTEGKINDIDISTENEEEIEAIKDYLAKQQGIAYINSKHKIGSGTYTIFYEATDAAGNKSATKSYTMEVSNTADTDAQAPTITLNTKLESSYTTKDVVKYTLPTIKDDKDDNEGGTDDSITYEFFIDDEGQGKLEFEDGKYEIDLSKAPAGATSFTITIESTDDFGNKVVKTDSAKIADISDTDVPQFVSATGGTTVGSAVSQNSDIILPTIEYSDSYASVMNYKIVAKVNTVDGKELTFDDGSFVYGDYPVRAIGTKYVVDAGKFVAAYEGDYQIAVIFTDPAGNYVSNYFEYSATTSREDKITILSSGAINGNGEAKVGDVIKFAVPTISAELASANDKILNIDENNAINDDSFFIEVKGGSFERLSQTSIRVKEAKTYEITYVADIKVERADGTTDTIPVRDTAAKKLVVKAATASKTYTLSGAYEASYDVNSDIEILGVEGLDSDVSMTNSTIAISYKGATESPLATINLEEFFSGNTKNNSALKYEGGKYYFTASQNAVYTIKYTIKDKTGKEYVAENGKASYSVNVGNIGEPEIIAKEGFIEDVYKTGSTFTLDVGKLILRDKGVGAGDTEADEAVRKALLDSMEVKLVRNEDGKDIEIESIEADGYKYKLDVIGDYTLTIKVVNEAGYPHTEPFTFRVSNQGGVDATHTYQTLGTVLIVLASLILVGVIAYFIISKIKSDKELKGKNSKRK